MILWIRAAVLVEHGFRVESPVRALFITTHVPTAGGSGGGGGIAGEDAPRNIGVNKNPMSLS